MKLPATVEQVERSVSVVITFRTFMTNIAQNMILWYKLFRKNVDVSLREEHLKVLKP